MLRTGQATQIASKMKVKVLEKKVLERLAMGSAAGLAFFGVSHAASAAPALSRPDEALEHALPFAQAQSPTNVHGADNNARENGLANASAGTTTNTRPSSHESATDASLANAATGKAQPPQHIYVRASDADLANAATDKHTRTGSSHESAVDRGLAEAIAGNANETVMPSKPTNGQEKPYQPTNPLTNGSGTQGTSEAQAGTKLNPPATNPFQPPTSGVYENEAGNKTPTSSEHTQSPTENIGTGTNPANANAGEAQVNHQAKTEEQTRTSPTETQGQPDERGETKFKVASIDLVVDGLILNEKDLRSILAESIGKDITMAELNSMLNKLTSYCRRRGYPAAAAYLPEQEMSAAGNIQVRIIPGRYGEVHVVNHSQLNDDVVHGFLAGLKHGAIIRTRSLETALYSISDKSSTKAVGSLSPGKDFGTSDLTVTVDNGKMQNTILYSENYGNETTGRYRYGVQHTLYDIDGRGGKVNLGYLLSNKDLRNGFFNYETLVGRGGASLGIGYSRMNYTLHGLNASGTYSGIANTVSLFGSAPIFHTDFGQLAFNYGIDWRSLSDQIGSSAYTSDKNTRSIHIGLSGNTLNPATGTYASYDFTITRGKLNTNPLASTISLGRVPSNYTKAEANAQIVQSLGHKSDIILKGSAQKSANNLDGSEQMYLGGEDSIRAYRQGLASGDEGYTTSAELRYFTDVPGLTLSTFYDFGQVRERRDGSGNKETLKGWGLALAYSKPGDWFARLEWARPVGRPSIADDVREMSKSRIWFILGKIW